jgi:hypothetical protein
MILCSFCREKETQLIHDKCVQFHNKTHGKRVRDDMTHTNLTFVEWNDLAKMPRARTVSQMYWREGMWRSHKTYNTWRIGWERGWNLLRVSWMRSDLVCLHVCVVLPQHWRCCAAAMPGLVLTTTCYRNRSGRNRRWFAVRDRRQAAWLREVAGCGARSNDVRVKIKRDIFTGRLKRVISRMTVDPKWPNDGNTFKDPTHHKSTIIKHT